MKDTNRRALLSTRSGSLMGYVVRGFVEIVAIRHRDVIVGIVGLCSREYLEMMFQAMQVEVFARGLLATYLALSHKKC
jgi:hypothetical protein